MMLQALIAFAEREGLGDADFEKVGVRWIIPLDRKGILTADPIPLTDNPEDKRSRPKQMWRAFTSANELNQGTKSHFLCDTLERATMFLDPKITDKAPARRLQHDYFKSLLAEAVAVCPDESGVLRAVTSFLEESNAVSRLHQYFVKAKAKPTDIATFSVDGICLLEIEAFRKFWRARRNSNPGAPKNHRICIATGVLAETLNTTEKVKGIPGGLATGTNLISFDKDAFCSFGLEQAQNAALSVPAELKLRAALNRLVEISRAQRLVYNNAIYLHWTRKPADFDPLDPVVSGDPEAIARLLRSAQGGQRVVGLDANAYYALSLSGNGARIVVRDWLESTVPEVERHVAAWFQDLAIVPPDGVGLKREFKLGALLYGMVREDLEELPPQLPTQLLHAALRGTPLPQLALVAALRRQHVEHRKPEDKYDPKLNPARMALIKACLLRSPNRKETDTMTERLDPGSKDIAYLCGQLFAVIGRLQLIALGKVGASLADRTYGGVATRPATTLGPVFTKLPPYLKKANTRFPGSGTNKQKEIETLSVRIEALGGLPRTLDLEEQGRFALGYYCQLAQYRTDRAEAEAAEKAQELQDDANLA